jgi:hypothetical protein
MNDKESKEEDKRKSEYQTLFSVFLFFSVLNTLIFLKMLDSFAILPSSLQMILPLLVTPVHMEDTWTA